MFRDYVIQNFCSVSIITDWKRNKKYKLKIVRCCQNNMVWRNSLYFKQLRLKLRHKLPVFPKSYFLTSVVVSYPTYLSVKSGRWIWGHFLIIESLPSSHIDQRQPVLLTVVAFCATFFSQHFLFRLLKETSRRVCSPLVTELPALALILTQWVRLWLNSCYI